MNLFKKSIDYLLLSCGWICVGLGLIGAFLPILPTTPFILLAAFFFSKGSKKCHQWLRNNQLFGKIVCDWEQNHSVALKTKIIASIIMFFVFSLSLIIVTPVLWIKFLIFLVGVSVLIYLWTRPTTQLSLQRAVKKH